MLNTKFVKIGPAVLEKKMLTHDARWTMTAHDDGSKPIPIGHLSNSGDLKILIFI